MSIDVGWAVGKAMPPAIAPEEPDGDEAAACEACVVGRGDGIKLPQTATGLGDGLGDADAEDDGDDAWVAITFPCACGGVLQLTASRPDRTMPTVSRTA